MEWLLHGLFLIVRAWNVSMTTEQRGDLASRLDANDYVDFLHFISTASRILDKYK